MVVKILVFGGEINIFIIMIYGYNLKVGKWSLFYGVLYVVVEFVCKLVVIGGNYSIIRFIF